MNIAVLSTKPSLYSTRRLVQAGRERGHNMRVINHLRCKLIIEKNNPHIFYHHRLLNNIDAIIPRIGASVTFFGAAVIKHFEMMDVVTATTSQGLLRSRDKLTSLQLLTTSGLEIPKTAFANYTKDVRQFIQSVGDGPWVIKLLEGTQGLGVVLAENMNAAESVIEAFDKIKARIIVQEFIKEAAGKDIRAFVVDGHIVGAMQRKAKEGEFRSNLHRGGTAELITLSEEEERAAKIAAYVMGLDVAGVDILQSNRGPLIMEVNASPGLEGIEGATKVNVAGKIIELLEEKYKEARLQKND